MLHRLASVELLIKILAPGGLEGLQAGKRRCLYQACRFLAEAKVIVLLIIWQMAKNADACWGGTRAVGVLSSLQLGPCPVGALHLQLPKANENGICVQPTSDDRGWGIDYHAACVSAGVVPSDQ